MLKGGRVSRHLTSLNDAKFRNEYDVNKREMKTETDDTGNAIHV